MYSYSYSVIISHACSGIFSRGIFRDMTTKAYLMALRTDQKWSRVLGPGVAECKRPLPEEPSAPISHTDPPYIASAITCDMFQFHTMHWRLLHLNLLHRIHLKVLQSTIRLVGPQWVHHRQYLSPRPLWECNFFSENAILSATGAINCVTLRASTQCMRCLPAQCEVLVPFYRLHPCGVHRTISNIHYTWMLKMLNFSMSTYFIHFEDYATT